METSSVLLGILLLLLFVGPMFYLAYNHSAKEKKRIKKLQLLSQKNQLTLDESEYLSPVSLGLDKASKKLLVIQQIKPQRELTLDLNNVRSCSLQRLNADKKSTEVLDEVQDIHLLLKNSSGTDESIPFYTDENDSAAEKEGRLAAASRWHKLIASSLN